MKKATLVLGAAPRVAVPIARSLRRIGVPCVVGTFSAKSSALGSNAAHRSVRLPHPIAGAPFIKALTSLIETENIDTMFPGSDVAMVGIGDHFGEVGLLLASPDHGPSVHARHSGPDRDYDSVVATDAVRDVVGHDRRVDDQTSDAHPRAYRVGLRLRALGADDALIADCLGVDADAIVTLLDIGARKLEQIELAARSGTTRIQ